jgi:hypothetical protein
MSKLSMTKNEIKQALINTHSGWKDIDSIVDEIHESLSTVSLPPFINKELGYTDDDESRIEEAGS